MKPRINIITLAVDDLEKSLTFYRDGLSLPRPWYAGADHVAFELQPDLSLVLYPRIELAKIANQTDAVGNSSGCILSHAAANKEEVDTILRRAEAAGGTLLSQPAEEPWGHSGYFKDPDGHLWQIMCGPGFEAGE